MGSFNDKLNLKNDGDHYLTIYSIRSLVVIRGMISRVSFINTSDILHIAKN